MVIIGWFHIIRYLVPASHIGSLYVASCQYHWPCANINLSTDSSLLENWCWQDDVWLPIHVSPSDKEHTLCISKVLLSFSLINTCALIVTIHKLYTYHVCLKITTINERYRTQYRIKWFEWNSLAVLVVQ